ncbi:MAG: inorganic diphosphatase, partial [Burkholderiaceae bacterium]
MSLKSVPPGDRVPEEFNVIIEIPAHSDPIKYEVDKDTGALFVDRFMMTSMHYPCNYGYVPETISDDGDPVDVLVITPFPVAGGAVVACRAIGVLQMEDEAGGDEKILAVPAAKLTRRYENVHNYTDLPQITLEQIQHFFERYKDLEP